MWEACRGGPDFSMFDKHASHLHLCHVSEGNITSFTRGNSYWLTHKQDPRVISDISLQGDTLWEMFLLLCTQKCPIRSISWYYMMFYIYLYLYFSHTSNKTFDKWGLYSLKFQCLRDISYLMQWHSDILKCNSNKQISLYVWHEQQTGSGLFELKNSNWNFLKMLHVSDRKQFEKGLNVILNVTY